MLAPYAMLPPPWNSGMTPFALHRSGEGLPLVLLHGFGGDHTAWLSIVSRLRGTPTLAYDLPGHGRSLDVPGGGRPSAMAKAVLADLGERGIERFHLAGHSMGGATATMVALRAPERLASLTLVAPGGFGPEIAIDTLRAWADATSDTALSRALKRMTAPGHITGAFEIARIAAMRRRPGQREMLREIVGGMADENGRQGAFDRAKLREAFVTVRTSLVWGEADPVLPFSQGEGWGDALQLYAVPKAGHMLMEERAAAVAKAIKDTITL